MLANLLTKVIGSRNQRLIKNLQKTVHKINSLENTVKQLSNNELKAKTCEFRQRIKQGETIDDLLPKAFAVVREAARRTLGLRHFDVQLIGGMVLHQGKIAEMRTGEGKTLMATLPAYLNTLNGNSVHVITVNDYLAKRDAAWMQPIYQFLDLTVGVILSGQEAKEKRAAYACDVVYGTNNEFGFDYLRDNMAFSLSDKVQRDLGFAIIDEVDSILIDEARTPLIISGADDDSSDMYQKIDRIVPQLIRQEKDDTRGDYYIDEKTRQAYLSEEGHQHVESLLTKSGLIQESSSLYDLANISLMHHVNAALRAHACFHKDVEYIIQNCEIVIVDEHTGRTMPGRRWSDGLHQAIEAKENVAIQQENITLASITFQNFFRLYQKLSGMTGTADTEAYEFQQIYGLEVVVIPTNKPMIRKDLPDQIYLTAKEKFDAIIDDIKERLEKQQPILVGTASIEVSEHLSRTLNKANIKHQVLNAKFHEKEAQIIAEAGRPGTVTIATNMAGRGTDIVLGGNVKIEIAAMNDPSAKEQTQLREKWQKDHEQVIEAGGLHIIGSERHESRRIDNQLRGRSGRQGDPGSSRFYLSLEDNLMRIFASERMAGMMQKLGMEKGEAIEHSWINKIIENAQRKVEGHNFDIRKQLLEFDDVANDQRKVIYHHRNSWMAKDDISADIAAIRERVVNMVIDDYVPPDSLAEQWNIPGLKKRLMSEFALELALEKWLDEDDNLGESELRQHILQQVINNDKAKEQQVGSDTMRQFEKSVLLQSFDHQWREHLAAMDHLRQGIHLRGYAQKNPKQEYKREAFEMFQIMLLELHHNIITMICKAQFVSEEDVQTLEEQRQQMAGRKSLSFEHASFAKPEIEQTSRPQPVKTMVREQPKIGRNQPCPCGSAKKYKHCHGKLN